ncbi:hypothetical protein PR202_ga11127 [Eleusine coracana subsp. coracana]|uniref:glutamate--cysteine ligase n=1 Tax=Eleusine coracana subsp. coracana TaxID=191504 RepID=A0AAV5C8J8_ELECO|nr:hypothetical protein PR202_ga11127 [Eleusine coracana subsp. coracana]
MARAPPRAAGGARRFAVVRLPAAGRRGRTRGGAVAASPPTEEAVQMTEPLTKDDLVAYLVSGCKPKENWRIGTEHEKFGFELETLRPIRYDQIRDILNGLAERFDWEKIMEGNSVIGLKQGKQSISLEPGGQFELSGAPLETLHQTCAEVNSHLYQVKALGEEMGIGFLGIGFQPKWALSDIPIMPKIATAIFANSPFKEGKPNGFLSLRSHIWTDTDNNRAGMLPFVFDDSFGFEQYVDYALDVPMYFVYRNKKYIDCTGMSFRVPVTGLKTPFRDGYVRDLAEEVLKLAKSGLERRGYKEVGFLREVDAVVRTGVTPAEKLLNLYETKWQRNVDPVFKELLY